MQKPYHIVFTTIFNPENILQALFDNISKYHHLDKVKIWIVGDKKTPSINAEQAVKFSKQGLETEFFSVENQDKWGHDLDFYPRVPYNNTTRRNFGFLKALEAGCRVLISIDDDNFPTDDDFIGCYTQVGKEYAGGLVSEPAGFHNICEYLEFEPARPIYARGFPFRLRSHRNQPTVQPAPKQARIGVLEGLWLVEPDIDAVTWLNGKVISKQFRGQELTALQQGTWSPINFQNTALLRQLLPAILALPMGWPVPGGKIERYDDVWGGYFLQAAMQGSPYYMAFGRPIVEHRRNPHNYLDDLRGEFWGIILTDWLVEKLKGEFRSSRNKLDERMLDLADFVERSAEDLPQWRPQEMKDFIIRTAGSMRMWVKACGRIGI